MATMLNGIVPSEQTCYVLRVLASVLIKEANERGDLDHATIEFVAGKLLRLSIDGDNMRKAQDA